MRGRTNLIGSGNLTINAETKQFTVAEGTQVIAGDFVEYQTQKDESLLANAYIDFYNQTKIGENLALTLSNRSLLLLKMINGQLKIINSYNEHVINDYLVLLDGSIVIRIADFPYIIRLKIENETFHVVCQAEEVPNNIKSDIIKLAEYNEKLYLIGNKRGEYSSSLQNYAYELVFYRFDISDVEKVLYIDKNENGADLERSYYFDFKSVLTVKDYIYIVYERKTYSTGLAEQYLMKIKIDDNTNNISHIEKIEQNVGMKQKPIVFYEKYIFWSYEDKIYLYNTSANIISSYIDLHNIGFLFGYHEYLKFSVFSKINNEKLALFYYSEDSGRNKHHETAVIQIDEATGNMSRISNIYGLSSQHSITQNIEVIYLDGIVNDIDAGYSGTTISYSISYNQQTNLLSDKIDTTSVKPYMGGSTLGVAKQSGSAGQEVEVYVPKI